MQDERSLETEILKHDYPIVKELNVGTSDALLINSVLGWKEKKFKLIHFKIINEEYGKIFFEDREIIELKRNDNAVVVTSFTITAHRCLGLIRRLLSFNIPLSSGTSYPSFIGPVLAGYVRYIRRGNQSFFIFKGGREILYAGDSSITAIALMISRDVNKYLYSFVSHDEICRILEEAIAQGYKKLYRTRQYLSSGVKYIFKPQNDSQAELFPEIMV